MITGFLKNNRKKPSASRCDNIGWVPARWAWVPPKDKETVLMMHEIAVGCIDVTKPVKFDLAKFDRGENQGPRLWKKVHVPHEGLHRWHGGFPPGRYLHSFCRLPMSAQDVFPLGWYSQCGCGDETEVDVCKRGRTGAALTGIPCEELKRV